MVLYKNFEHPSNVCMNYVSHFKFSMYLSYELAKASICSFIHAIYPDILITYSSEKIYELQCIINEIGCR